MLSAIADIAKSVYDVFPRNAAINVLLAEGQQPDIAKVIVKSARTSSPALKARALIAIYAINSDGSASDMLMQLGALDVIVSCLRSCSGVSDPVFAAAVNAAMPIVRSNTQNKARFIELGGTAMVISILLTEDQRSAYFDAASLLFVLLQDTSLHSALLDIGALQATINITTMYPSNNFAGVSPLYMCREIVLSQSDKTKAQLVLETMAVGGVAQTIVYGLQVDESSLVAMSLDLLQQFVANQVAFDLFRSIPKFSKSLIDLLESTNEDVRSGVLIIIATMCPGDVSFTRRLLECGIAPYLASALLSRKAAILYPAIDISLVLVSTLNESVAVLAHTRQFLRNLIGITGLGVSNNVLLQANNVLIAFFQDDLYLPTLIDCGIVPASLFLLTHANVKVRVYSLHFLLDITSFDETARRVVASNAYAIESIIRCLNTMTIEEIKPGCFRLLALLGAENLHAAEIIKEKVLEKLINPPSFSTVDHEIITQLDAITTLLRIPALHAPVFLSIDDSFMKSVYQFLARFYSNVCLFPVFCLDCSYSIVS